MLTSSGKSNFENFLECSSPHIPIHYYIQTNGSSSSSSSVAASGAKEEVRKPRICLGDIWSAYEDWSCCGLEVPVSLDDEDHSMVAQYYAPSLSAIQIFTIKPIADDSSSRSGKEIGSADNSGYLYFQYNETERPYDRKPFTCYVTELAKEHSGLSTLTSSDLSPESWISVAWSPIYSIPSVTSKKELTASFLTYHSLTPNFPETIGKEDKGNEQGASSITEVELPAFGAVTYKASGKVWIMPGTLDGRKRAMHEESASSWLATRGFCHSDFNFYMSRRSYGLP